MLATRSLYGDDVYKLHHIPSGILNAGVLNLITAGVVINPPTIIEEITSFGSTRHRRCCSDEN